MIDARGYSCPEPVIMVKKALEQQTDEKTCEVLVDNHAALENITRFVTHQGYAVESSAQGEDFLLKITRK
ncbi:MULTISPECIES: sulfurtransferase TusA family protein [Megasphaera]|nr:MULTISPECIES: sulfurtransferase TusA family protein [Megasphaera]